tara:strand:+ start:21 stop:521 length:501 start_codon:yes stop_codon:yes gene_type:complete
MANNHSKYQVIRVTPTLDTSQYDDGDVLFNALEIPNAVLGKGGSSKLVSMFVYSQIGTVIDATFIFSENSLTLGSQNATANAGDATFESANLTGMVFLDGSQVTTTHIDNSRFFASCYSASVDSPEPQLLQAASDSTSVYLSAIITGGTPTFAADSLDLILHIERQ